MNTCLLCGKDYVGDICHECAGDSKLSQRQLETLGTPCPHCEDDKYLQNKNMTLKQTIFDMLKTNTGTHMLDSGGANGRAWQRNADKSLKDFEAEPVVTGDKEDGETVSLFHYLIDHAGLSLDSLCDEYNELPCPDWESDVYGVSKDQKTWLDDRGFTVLDSFNSYNGEQYLSQVIQGTYITLDGTNIPDYVLLQVHQGADVRGGYTDAKLFKVKDGYLMPEDSLLETNE